MLDDADLTVAVDCAVNGAYFSTGQRCTASSRLIVTAGIHDRFVDGLTDRLKKLVVDDALKPGAEMGPVVDENQLGQDLRYLDVGKSEGARLHWGGERLNRENPGFYLQPALFTEATNQMRIAREEIFGPVAAVIRVKDYEESLATANDTPFGLSVGIATTGLKYASHFKRNSQAGMVSGGMVAGALGAWYCGLVMDGTAPAKVPDAVIAEIRSREREGAIELPPKVRPGDRVRVLRGPFRDHLAIYAGMTGRDRVAVLLRLLGGERRILLPRCDIES